MKWLTNLVTEYYRWKLFFGDYEFISWIKVTYKGQTKYFPLLKNKDYLVRILKFECPSAAIFPVPLKFAEKYNCDRGIYCNEAFLSEYDKETQLAVIYHELGHYFLRHFELPTYVQQNNAELEYEADGFATCCGKGEGLLTALEWHLNFATKKKAEHIVEELNRRMDKIRQTLEEKECQKEKAGEVSSND